MSGMKLKAVPLNVTGVALASAPIAQPIQQATIQTVAQPVQQNVEVNNNGQTTPVQIQEAVTNETKVEVTENQANYVNGPIVRSVKEQKKVTDKIIIDVNVLNDKIDAFKARINSYPDTLVPTEIQTDELKAFNVLWEEGKMPYDGIKGTYVLSYDVYSDCLNKIFIDDIVKIFVTHYYDDVTLANPTLMYTKHLVYHRGRLVFNTIDTNTYAHLCNSGIIANNKIPVLNSYVDLNTRVKVKKDFDANVQNRVTALQVAKNNAKECSCGIPINES